MHKMKKTHKQNKTTSQFFYEWTESKSAVISNFDVSEDNDLH